MIAATSGGSAPSHKEAATQALRLIAEGASAVQAARTLGIPKWAVDYVVRVAGGTGALRQRRSQGPARVVDRAAVVALYRDGVPLRTIAERVGCNATTITLVLREAGEKRARQIVDITGQRFGSLVAIEIATKADNDAYLWRCRCDCGRFRLVTRSHLTSKSRRATACRVCIEMHGRVCSGCGERGHDRRICGRTA